jgi:hypothetical protein
MQTTPDFSKMSDVDLEKYISSSSPSAPATPDFSKMSDVDLEKYISSSSPSATSASERKTPEQTQGEIEEYAQKPWSNVLMEGASNLPSSFGNAIGDVASAIYNYKDTLGALKQMGTGAYSKAAGALGVKQDPEEKAQNEQLINALGQHYAEQYGTTGGFKRALAKDPFSIGMDVSLPLSLGASAGAKAAGLTGQVARMAGRAATVMDPVQSALAVAKLPIKLGAWSAGKAQAGLSGVPSSSFRAIQEVASSGTPEQKAAFFKMARDPSEHSEIANTAMRALEEKKGAANQAYLNSMAEAGQSPAQLNLDNIVQLDNTGSQILQSVMNYPGQLTDPQIAHLNSVLLKHTTGGALRELNDFVNLHGTTSRFSQAQSMVEDINKQIFEALRNPHPMARTVIDLDNLKQSIGDALHSAKGTRFEGKIGNVYNSVKNTIFSHAPEYGSAMESWQNWRNLLNDYQRSLSLKDKAGADAIVRKLMKANDQPGVKQSLLQTLSETNAGKTLPAMLSGAAVSPWFAQGTQAMIGYPGAAGLALLHPSTIPHILGGALASSPRLMGYAHYGKGMLNRPVGAATSAATSPLVSTGLYRTEEARQDQAQSTGGRIERREGGRVGIDHSGRAASLVRAAETAKKQESKTTEPLLQAPDERIVKALSIANEAI